MVVQLVAYIAANTAVLYVVHGSLYAALRIVIPRDVGINLRRYRLLVLESLIKALAWTTFDEVVENSVGC